MSPSRAAVPPFELETLGLQECVDEIEDVELDALAVDLGEDVAHLVELDVGDLELINDPLGGSSEAIDPPAELLRQHPGDFEGIRPRRSFHSCPPDT